MIRWKLWVIGAIGVALAGMVWLWRGEIESRVRYMVEGEQMEQAIREAENEADRQRKLRRRADDIAEVRKARVEALRARERDLSDSLRALERDNQAVREWSDGRLPPAIVERLRQRAGGADGDGGGNAAD